VQADQPAAILYLHGLGSGPHSQKAELVRGHAARLRIAAVVPDLNLPSRDQLSFGAQRGCALQSLELLCQRTELQRVVVVGSSFGGFLALHALHAASAGVRARVCGLVLLGALSDPWQREGGLLSEAAEGRWRSSGAITLGAADGAADAPAVCLPYRFAEEVKALTPRAWEVRVPAIVLHGRYDAVVPCVQSERFVQGHPERELWLLEDQHRLLDHAAEVKAAIDTLLGVKSEGR
jgi:pimeloyl-ACP methyl ester carboxylesterase